MYKNLTFFQEYDVESDNDEIEDESVLVEPKARKPKQLISDSESEEEVRPGFLDDEASDDEDVQEDSEYADDNVDEDSDYADESVIEPKRTAKKSQVLSDSEDVRKSIFYRAFAFSKTVLSFEFFTSFFRTKKSDFSRQTDGGNRFTSFSRLLSEK